MITIPQKPVISQKNAELYLKEEKIAGENLAKEMENDNKEIVQIFKELFKSFLPNYSNKS